MCINSWLKHCPDYKLMLWHDKMPEFQEIINKSPFVKRAYDLKLWAFVADYIRCYALYKHGGIYLDTDVELMNNFDNFLKNDFFISTEGDILFGENVPEPAVMGGVAGHKIFKECMKIYVLYPQKIHRIHRKRNLRHYFIKEFYLHILHSKY